MKGMFEKFIANRDVVIGEPVHLSEDYPRYGLYLKALTQLKESGYFPQDAPNPKLILCNFQPKYEYNDTVLFSGARGEGGLQGINGKFARVLDDDTLTTYFKNAIFKNGMDNRAAYAKRITDNRITGYCVGIMGAIVCVASIDNAVVRGSILAAMFLAYLTWGIKGLKKDVETRKTKPADLRYLGSEYLEYTKAEQVNLEAAVQRYQDRGTWEGRDLAG